MLPQYIQRALLLINEHLFLGMIVLASKSTYAILFLRFLLLVSVLGMVVLTPKSTYPISFLGFLLQLLVSVPGMVV